MTLACVKVGSLWRLLTAHTLSDRHAVKRSMQSVQEQSARAEPATYLSAMCLNAHHKGQ